MLFVIIALAALLSYINSLENKFIWDDEDWVLRNSTVQDWRRWPELFKYNSIQGARKGSNFYRPIQAITHGIDYLLWGRRLAGHHITNILFHALTALMLYLLLLKILSQHIAFISALFFAIHPVHTEAVTYISGRADPISSLFVLLTILLFERHPFLSYNLFILAVLSKESAIVAPLLLILYLWAKDRDLKKEAGNILPFVVIIIIYAALRFTILNFLHSIPENAPKAFFYVPIYIRLATFLKTLPVYFMMLLWPFGLHMERDIDLSHSIFEPQAFLSLLIILVVFIAGFRIRHKYRFLLFSALWFFIAIFPNSNIFPINALIYEHWLYLPSVGFFIVCAWLLGKIPKTRRSLKLLSLASVLFISIFYVWRTMERNKEWHDPISFYESTIKYKPDSARLHNNLAMAYADEGREDDAIREYKKAIECGDYYAQPHYNLSNIYIGRGDYATAIKELKRSLEIDNNFLYSHESLSQIYFKLDRFDEAEKEALFILEREPQNKIAKEILNRISKSPEGQIFLD